MGCIAPSGVAAGDCQFRQSMYRRVMALLLAGAALHGVPAQASAAEAQPAWLRQRLAQLQASRRPDAIEVWKLSYRGADAYLFIAGCCDRHNPLLDAQGRTICAPTGGITGRGDGRCTEPLPDPEQRVKLWSAPVN